jgi:hypothetical protein
MLVEEEYAMTMKRHERGQPIRLIPRRAVLTEGSKMLAAIAIATSAVRPVFAKAKSNKEDFFFQETPDEDTGRKCPGCINFTPKSTGLYGADSGDCALLEGDVCTHCYCQGWTDKNKPGAKKAGA